VPSSSLDEAAAIAERIRAAVESEPAQFASNAIGYTVSAGVPTMDGAARGLDDLIRRADTALCQAKDNGRNHIHVQH